MKSVRKNLVISPDLADKLGHVSTESGLPQSQIVEQALAHFFSLRDNGPESGPGGYAPNDSEVITFFAKLDEEKGESVKSALADHGVTSQLTRAQLLAVASKISGRAPAALLDEGLDYACQRAVTTTVAGSGKQGSLGAADERIVQAITQLREMVSNGIYKPRADKEGRLILGLSNIGGKAMTGVTTVRSFLERKPEFEALLDVTDL